MLAVGSLMMGGIVFGVVLTPTHVTSLHELVRYPGNILAHLSLRIAFGPDASFRLCCYFARGAGLESVEKSCKHTPRPEVRLRDTRASAFPHLFTFYTLLSGCRTNSLPFNPSHQSH